MADPTRTITAAGAGFRAAGASFAVVAGQQRAFWDGVAAGTYEPHIAAALAERAGPGRRMVDIGAWLGVYSLLAAALGSDVVAYEPDPVACAGLRANLAANGDLALRVAVRAAAVTRRGGRVGLAGGEHGMGASLTRVRRGREVAAEAARSVGASSAEEAGARRGTSPGAGASPVVVKLDIEGGEFAVLGPLVRGFAGAPATFVLSVHGFRWRRWAEGPARPLRLVVARGVGAVQRARLVLALRRHLVRRWDGTAWVPLGWTFLFRLAETDLLAEPRRARALPVTNVGTMSTIDRHAEWDELRTAHLRPKSERPASQARGVHHLALLSSDVGRTIRFYQDLLGFPLTELFENRDYPGSTHFFFDIGNGNALAFFDFPGLDLGSYAEVLGGLHHVALSVSREGYEAAKVRLAEAGIATHEVAGESLYFADPDGVRVELIAEPLGEMLGEPIL